MNFQVTLLGKPPKSASVTAEGGRIDHGEWRRERICTSLSPETMSYTSLCSHELQQQNVLFQQNVISNSLILPQKERCPRNNLYSTRKDGARTPRSTAHTPLWEQQPLGQPPASSCCTFQASPRMLPAHQWAHCGYWSQVNPTRRHKTPLAGNDCPRTSHHVSWAETETFSELYPVGLALIP